MTQPACDISVIIPCHNAEAWIGDTVASATAQAGVDLEVILVDDGSTDRSVERAEQASASLRVIRQTNAGVSRARNVGTAAARGRFVQYLDADDLLLPDTLRRQRDALTQSGADVAYCDWIRFDGEPDGSFRDGEVVRRALSQRPDHDLFLGAWWPVGALLYRRGTVDAILPWREDLPIIQDARFCLDAALTGARFVHVDHIGVRYRSHPNSLSRRDRKAFVEDCYRNAVDVHERWLRDGPLDADRRRTLAVVYWSVARPFFQIDRTRFAEVVDRLRDLDPHFASLGPRQMQVVARIVGYPAAEHIAQYWRGLKAMARP